jgi:general secretion pathway protein G
MKPFKTILIGAGIIIFLLGAFIFLAPSLLFPANIIKTRWDSARPKMAIIESAIDVYVKNTGHYPGSLDELLITPPGMNEPYLKSTSLYDPWGNKYIYEPNSLNPEGYDLISYGADGKPGGKGENKDISKKIIEDKKNKSNETNNFSIKTTIVFGVVLLLIETIIIYKYKTKNIHS